MFISHLYSEYQQGKFHILAFEVGIQFVSLFMNKKLCLCLGYIWAILRRIMLHWFGLTLNNSTIIGALITFTFFDNLLENLLVIGHFWNCLPWNQLHSNLKCGPWWNSCFITTSWSTVVPKSVCSFTNKTFKLPTHQQFKSIVLDT